MIVVMIAIQTSISNMSIFSAVDEHGALICKLPLASFLTDKDPDDICAVSAVDKHGALIMLEFCLSVWRSISELKSQLR